MKKKLFSTTLLLLLFINTTAASELTSAKSLASQGVIKAQADASDYRLGDTITRKEMMKIVMNLSGNNVPDICSGMFLDVENDWGCKYIEEALSQNYIALNESFRPNDTITKSESVKLILKARGIEKIEDTTDWQKDYMQTAFKKGLIDSEYSDHNTQALRGWIFDIAAAPISEGNSGVLSTGVEATWGIYEDYSTELIGRTEATVLFFHASWCPSCQVTDQNLLANDFLATDLTLLKVDFDTELTLRQKYGVTTQHTFVQIDSNGDFIKKWTGSNDLADIEEKTQ